MLLLNINGPINAGKTTVAGLLARRLEGCLFIEVDNLLSDEEQQGLGLDFWQGIALRLDRLDERLGEEIGKNAYSVIIFSYPMSEGNYNRWSAFAGNGVVFKSVTLAPSLEQCLKNRGTRALEPWETDRIREMYREGYGRPRHADFIINNDNETPEETALKIIALLGLDAKRQ